MTSTFSKESLETPFPCLLFFDSGIELIQISRHHIAMCFGLHRTILARYFILRLVKSILRSSHELCVHGSVGLGVGWMQEPMNENILTVHPSILHSWIRVVSFLHSHEKQSSCAHRLSKPHSVTGGICWEQRSSSWEWNAILELRDYFQPCQMKPTK